MNPTSTPDPSPKAAAAERRRRYRTPRRIFLGIIGLMVLTVLGFMVYVAFNLPPLAVIENPDSDLSTQLISADGEVLHKYYSRENRVAVGLNEISPHAINALIATEDVRFYGHSGIDPKSFFSILAGLVRGREIRGGSTLTMQLSRNLYEEVGAENKYIRKLKEYLVSAYIERKFTKLEIVQAYLNTVNIYGNSYGIETTANRLFDKRAKDLTIEEAAMIIGMLKGQGVFNPIKHPDTTLYRRNTVINLMVEHGFLDPAQLNIDSLKRIPLNLAAQEEAHIKGAAPYFREYVRQQLGEWCEKNGYNLYTDGLRVYTTLDSRMQRHLEAAVQQHMPALQQDFDRIEQKAQRYLEQDPSILEDMIRLSDRRRSGLKAGKSEAEIKAEFSKPVRMQIFGWEGYQDTVMTPLDSLRHYARFLETGAVSIDPSNGHVKAWVGGIDYRFFKYDHVAEGKRQVGSTFKPFVYGAAINSGYKPCDRLLNQPVVFETPGAGRWVPKNSDGSIGGMMSLSYALANSVNLITAQLINELTPRTVAQFAYDMGISSKLDEVPALCLGVSDLSVLELTSAYGTFANLGVRTQPLVITRIEDKNGRVLANFAPEAKEVLSPEKAYQVTELLMGVVDFGTGHRLRNRFNFKNEIAGKTGTTQNQSDGWFVGATPSLVTGVWVGCADRRIRFRSIAYGQGANMALPLWGHFMQAVYADPAIGLAPVPFPRPASLPAACQPELTAPQSPRTGPDADNLGEGFE